MNPDQTFGQRVRQLRKEKHLSQNALAKLTGISPRTIFGYEAGTSFPRSYDMLLRLAEALDVTCEELAADSASMRFALALGLSRVSKTHAEKVTEEAVSLILGDSLSDSEKDRMMHSIMDAYWDFRHKASRGGLT